MKFKSQIPRGLGGVRLHGRPSRARSFEYDFVPDSPTPGVSGSIFLDRHQSLPDGSQADIVSLNIVQWPSATRRPIWYQPVGHFGLGTLYHQHHALQLLGAKDTFVLDGGSWWRGYREVLRSWNAPSVPDSAIRVCCLSRVGSLVLGIGCAAPFRDGFLSFVQTNLPVFRKGAGFSFL